MKKMYGFILILVSIPFMSAAAPKSQMYLVDTMECDGVLTTHNPGMHDDYKKIKMFFTSMKTTRHDGTLADALVIENRWWSDIYTSPLYVKQNRIRKRFGRNGVLDLKIVSSKTNDGVRTDVLKGNFSEEDIVVGDTNYVLQCEANVVKEVSRIDDFTRGGWLKLLPKNRVLAKKIVEVDGEDGKVWELFREGGEAFKARNLKGDAKKVYDKSYPEQRYVETIRIEELGVTLIHVSDTVDGNGTEYLFNLDGEYLNSISGTESSEWEWAVK